MNRFEILLLDVPQSVKDLLEGLKGLRENPEYHPEESAYEHIKIVTNRLEDTGDADLIMSGFLHDLYKLRCQVFNEKTGYPSSPEHDKRITQVIRYDGEMQQFIMRNGASVDNVAFICDQHMRVKRLGEMRGSKRCALMEHHLFSKLCLFSLADKMQNDWAECLVNWKDVFKSDSLVIGDVTIGWLREEYAKSQKLKALGVKKSHKVNGQNLIAIGFPQGKIIGLAIKVANEKFSDMPVGNVLELFGKLLAAPADFLKDESLGVIAQALVSAQENVVG